MNINVQIERLVLEGVPISASQGRLLQGVVEAELGRLLANEGIPDNWLSGGVAPGGAIQLKPGTRLKEYLETQYGQNYSQLLTFHWLYTERDTCGSDYHDCRRKVNNWFPGAQIYYSVDYVSEGEVSDEPSSPGPAGRKNKAKRRRNKASNIIKRFQTRANQVKNNPQQAAYTNPYNPPITRVHSNPNLSSGFMAKLMIGAVGDKYEQEADQVAAEVVSRINIPAPMPSGQGQAVQREAIQKKDDDAKLMRLPQVQHLSNAGGMAASPDVEASIQRAKGSGQLLGDNIRKPMEQAFGADFSGVRVHTDAKSDTLNQSIQAKAFTTGQDIFFRQGAYDQGSRKGQELIAHELTHVVQQRGVLKNQVQNTSQRIQRKEGDKWEGVVAIKPSDGSMAIQVKNSVRPWFNLPQGEDLSVGDIVTFTEGESRRVIDLKVTGKEENGETPEAAPQHYDYSRQINLASVIIEMVGSRATVHHEEHEIVNYLKSTTNPVVKTLTENRNKDGWVYGVAFGHNTEYLTQGSILFNYYPRLGDHGTIQVFHAFNRRSG